MMQPRAPPTATRHHGSLRFQPPRVLKPAMRESGQGSAPPPLSPPANRIGAARSRGVHGPERLLASDVTVGRLVLCIVRSEGREKWPAPAHTTHTQASRTASIAAACTGRAASVTKKPQSGPSRSLFLSTFTFFPRRF